METTTAALLSAAGRRISRCSASSIVWREVRGQHKLTIDGCIPSTKLPRDWSATSKTFEAGGYKWQITYEPYGYGNSWSDKYISVELVYGGRQQTDPLEFTFSLLDQAGKPVPRYSRSTEICFFNGDHKRKQGFHNFIRWKDLEESGCLRDNRFAIQCDITVIKDWALNSDVNNGGGAAAPPPARVVVPPPDLHEHLSNLLWKKQGTDVTIDVGGEATFDAHGWLLAARSPVFEAALLSATKDDKVPGGRGRRRMEIQGVEPKVFKALLHFMYTDALPEMKERDTTAMVKGLLAAAHGYKLQRLKLMCEDMLCKRIEVNTVAENLVVAEQLGCRALKDACVEFISVPGNLKAVMETKGFEKIRANCPTVLIQFFLEKMV